ncbi:MAG: ATP synthase F0 subunit C [Opitutales bacterium]|nr:ATP synthase F0 subunit C [Opitutales bacterium]
MLDILAQVDINDVINITDSGVKGALVAASAAIGVGLIGAKAVESVGRNPGASTKVLVQAIIAMALAEGLGLIALFL